MTLTEGLTKFPTPRRVHSHVTM